MCVQGQEAVRHFPVDRTLSEAAGEFVARSLLAAPSLLRRSFMGISIGIVYSI
jgi:hypothetical protein